jgi:hypothetical protein
MATTSRKRERFIEQVRVRLRDGAASVGVSEAALRSEIRLGRLEAQRMGRAVLIRLDELKRWADELPPAA